MKRTILSVYNSVIEKKMIEEHCRVIKSFSDVDINYCDIDNVVHYQLLDWSLDRLFYEKLYDTVLILDIDAIPLSSKAIEYTFDRAEQNILVGDIQRSNHIENNKHVYVGSSALCISKELYEILGNPSTRPTERGDTCEEFTYLCEQKGIPVEMYMPTEIDSACYAGCYWDLGDGMPQYGVGTTFSNYKMEKMFYHLFESRVSVHNEFFYKKCKAIQ